MKNYELQGQQISTSAQMGTPQIPREQEAEERDFFWRGTPEDYPETNTYEYERVRYIDGAGMR